MMDHDETWAALNAYVDGELPPAEAAVIAEAIARDRALAEQAALLTSLKAAVGECHETVDAKRALARYHRGRRRLAWAAAFLIGAFLASFFVMVDFQDPTGASLLAARAVHEQWVKTGPGIPSPSAGERLKTSLTDLDLAAYVPDLSAAKLRFAHLRQVPMATGKGLHIGYLGSHGCMVSLVVAPDAGDLEETLVLYDSARGPTYGWRVGDYGYFLMGDKMAPARLSVIAEILLMATRERAVIGEPMLLALRRSREANPPCMT
jgi:anti-sigma factor RsiW